MTFGAAVRQPLVLVPMRRVYCSCHNLYRLLQLIKLNLLDYRFAIIYFLFAYRNIGHQEKKQPDSGEKLAQRVYSKSE